jgi:hypothetical protein
MNLREWSVAVRSRDGACVKCGVTERLHAHHILRKSEHPDKALDVDNGMTLCNECHAKEHEGDFPGVVSGLRLNKFKGRKRGPKKPKPVPEIINVSGLGGRLKQLGWNQTKCAKICGVHQNTVTTWVREEKSPKYVLIFLDLLIAIKNLTGD